MVAVDTLVARVALVREVDLRRDAVVCEEGGALAGLCADDVLELAADAAGKTEAAAGWRGGGAAIPRALRSALA